MSTEAQWNKTVNLYVAEWVCLAAFIPQTFMLSSESLLISDFLGSLFQSILGCIWYQYELTAMWRRWHMIQNMSYMYLYLYTSCLFEHILVTFDLWLNWNILQILIKAGVWLCCFHVYGNFLSWIMQSLLIITWFWFKCSKTSYMQAACPRNILCRSGLLIIFGIKFFYINKSEDLSVNLFWLWKKCVKIRSEKINNTKTCSVWMEFAISTHFPIHLIWLAD